MEQQYNRAKWWQLLLFVFNNTASNIYLMTLNFVNLYAGNVAGIAVMLVSNVMMAARFWDGITDPIIGFVVDKTNGKFGKFRPFMLLGNLIMLGTIVLMFTTTHLVPEGFRAIYWIVIYLIYIIGYTFQNSATRGGQMVLTNDPKQRPMFARIDSIINALLITGLTVYITSYLTGKHGGYTAGLFRELIFVLGPASLILTILAIIAISEKDQPETYAKLGTQASYGFKDIFRIIKGNRAIQMLVVAASTDKLATQIRQNSAVGIMLYGIVMGNYALLSKMSMITLIPGMILIILGTSIAARFSSKQATIMFTWGSLITTALMGAVLIFGDPTQISLEHIGFMTIFTLSRNAVHTTQQFKDDPGSVLLATGAAWEGFDFPGDCVSLLVIPCLPFSHPDALKEKKRAEYPDLRSFIRAVAVPEMQIKLKQGFGRAIRTETDTCVVTILDERAAPGQRHFDAMRAALPEMQVTNSLQDVVDFIYRAKGPRYFKEWKP